MPEIEVDEERLGDFMGQMVGHLVGATTIACSILGHQLGLYKAMAGNGAMSADALASAAGTHPRLTREWLDQQASSGIVSYESEGDSYTLSPEAALALAEKHSPVWLAGGLPFIRSMFIDIDKVETAFRGDGAMGGANTTSACSTEPRSSSVPPMNTTWCSSGYPH